MKGVILICGIRVNVVDESMPWNSAHCPQNCGVKNAPLGDLCLHHFEPFQPEDIRRLRDTRIAALPECGKRETE